MPTNLLLLVEDEVLLHEILTDGLGEEGFGVEGKNDGLAAMAELDRRAAKYSAVITDIRLGHGPSGWDVGRHARKRIPDMPFIYMRADSVAGCPWKGHDQEAVTGGDKPLEERRVSECMGT